MAEREKGDEGSMVFRLNGGDIIARGTKDLIEKGVWVSPEAVERQWGQDAREDYERRSRDAVGPND